MDTDNLYIKQLEERLREKIKKLGASKSAHLLKVNPSYTHRIMTGEVTPTTKKILELLEKLP